jgi:hypothetical protein
MTTVLTKACPYVHTTSAIYKSYGIYLTMVDMDVLSPLSTSVTPFRRECDRTNHLCQMRQPQLVSHLHGPFQSVSTVFSRLCLIHQGRQAASW